MLQFTSEQLKAYISVLEEGDKAFTGDIQTDYVAQTQADIFFQLGIRDRELMKYGLNQIALAKDVYHAKMYNIIREYRAGTINSSVALSQWKEGAKVAMERTYRGGAAHVGNPFYKDLKIPRTDLRLMGRYLRKEGKFFKQLLFDIKDPMHKPLAMIPKDAKGNLLPGYRVQRWDYRTRANMYPESMKAMQYNGMLMGAGKNMEVRWVLGVPMTEHCDDCPRLARRVWPSYASLPTVPRAGDTQCLWKCYCHLEFRQKISRRTFDLAGSATSGAIQAAGRFGRVYDTAGNEIGGVLQAEVESYMVQEFKARQMMSVTQGEERMRWIQLRKEMNRLVIDRTKAGQYRAVPTVSVKALTETIKAVQARGVGVLPFGEQVVGKEVWFVRADYSAFGVIRIENGVKVFKSSTGVTLEIDGRMDILFATEKIPTGLKGYTEATIVSEVEIPSDEQGIHRTYKAELSNGESGCYKPLASSDAAKNEPLAYDVAKAMGWDDLIPMTVMKNGSEGMGSVQKWVRGQVWARTPERIKALVKIAEKERLYAYDVVVGNLDRHGKNYMTTKVGDKWKLKGIDNEYTLEQGTTGWCNSRIASEFARKTISASVKKALKKLLKNRSKLKHLFEVRDRYEASFWTRVRRLIKAEKYDINIFDDNTWQTIWDEEMAKLNIPE